MDLLSSIIIDAFAFVLIVFGTVAILSTIYLPWSAVPRSMIFYSAIIVCGAVIITIVEYKHYRVGHPKQNKPQKEKADRIEFQPKQQKEKPKKRGKFCEHCGARIISDAKFCEGCGKRL
jgi:hypothetical protein